MDIIEATKSAMLKGAGMTRPCFEEQCYILPTNTAECYIVIPANMKAGDKSAPRWNPHADDILADDWKITEYCDYNTTNK